MDRAIWDFWRAELKGVVLLLIVTIICGLVFSQLIASLIFALALYLSWHLYHMGRLAARLAQRKRLGPPIPKGIWGGIWTSIDSLQFSSRKRKRKLARFQTRFREAATALPDAVVILGRGNRIQWCNSSARRLLGLSWPRVVGKTLTQIIRVPTLDEYVAREDFQRPLELACPVDKAIVLSCQITPFGKKSQQLFVARDITRLYHLDQARRDFVANVSHELRTPLTVISGFLETLRIHKENDTQLVRPLDLMLQQTRRMQDIVSDLLTLSRLEMDDHDATDAPVPIPEMVAEIVTEARALSGTKKHKIELTIGAESGLLGNAEALRSAFSNLIFNAVKHTAARTKVNILWRVDTEEATLTVADSGEGIAARHLPRLTERFYRVDEGRSRKSGGTGLGLAIVKHVMQRHDARLSIVSVVGQGTQFVCRFPMARVVHEDPFDVLSEAEENAVTLAFEAAKQPMSS